VEQPVNRPMMPVAWTRELKTADGATQKVFTTTMGAATDLANEGLRRLVVNAVFWAVGLEVPGHAEVAPIGRYEPLMYGFNGFRKGVKPCAHALWKGAPGGAVSPVSQSNPESHDPDRSPFPP
jgi:hypothetical protein